MEESAQELIFERDESSLGEEEPSILIKRKIDKLREDEEKLKEYELELENELKRLREEPTQEEIDKIRKEYEESYRKKKRKIKKKKSKNSKRHHDMRRMKQEKIKRMLHYEPRKSKEEKKQQKIFVKEFKSDNEEPETPFSNMNKVEKKNIKYLEIDVGPLELSKSPIDDHQPKNNQEKIEEIIINQTNNIQAVQK